VRWPAARPSSSASSSDALPVLDFGTAPDQGWAIVTGWLTWLLPVLLVVGLLNLVRGLSARRRLGGFAGGVTAVRNLRAGTAMVTGTALAAEPLVAPVTGTPCVHWELSVSEDWRDPYPEEWLETNEAPAPRSGTVDHGATRRAVPFYVRDGTGDVLVTPDRAEITASSTFAGSVDRDDRAYYALDLPEHPSSLGVRHVSEAAVPVQAMVTVVGPVDVDGGAAQIRWTQRGGPSAGNRFLVTTEEPVRAERAERRAMVRHFAVAAACLIGMVVVLAVVAEPADADYSDASWVSRVATIAVD
jgi:hypothetical protein